MDLMTLTITTQPGRAELHGRFDAHEAPQLRAWIDEELFLERDRLTVDLSDVDFLDSTALAELVRGMKRARLAGGDLVLARPSETVKVILELTRLDAAFVVTDGSETDR